MRAEQRAGLPSATRGSSLNCAVYLDNRPQKRRTSQSSSANRARPGAAEPSSLRSSAAAHRAGTAVGLEGGRRSREPKNADDAARAADRHDDRPRGTTQSLRHRMRSHESSWSTRPSITSRCFYTHEHADHTHASTPSAARFKNRRRVDVYLAERRHHGHGSFSDSSCRNRERLSADPRRARIAADRRG